MYFFTVATVALSLRTVIVTISCYFFTVTLNSFQGLLFIFEGMLKQVQHDRKKTGDCHGQSHRNDRKKGKSKNN